MVVGQRSAGGENEGDRPFDDFDGGETDDPGVPGEVLGRRHGDLAADAKITDRRTRLPVIAHKATAVFWTA